MRMNRNGTSRRTLIAAGMTGLLPLTAAAAAPALRVERLPLWPGRPPGGEGISVTDQSVFRSPENKPDDLAWPHVATPMLTVVHPERPNGAAVLICPGGGYARVATGRTGGDVARRLAAIGITAFELLYRLPHDGWAAGPDTPLQDAQRAMRLIRGQAGKRWTVDPARVAVTGFSAGGHLAARLATQAATQTYAPVDANDALSARPLVAGLFYPVVTMGDDGVHAASRERLLGSHAADPAWQQRYSTERNLPADTPPTFITGNADDPVVPIRNSLLLWEALRSARIPTELLIFEHGGHGPPANRRNGAAVPWLDLFLGWASDHRWPA